MKSYWKAVGAFAVALITLGMGVQPALADSPVTYTSSEQVSARWLTVGVPLYNNSPYRLRLISQAGHEYIENALGYGAIVPPSQTGEPSYQFEMTWRFDFTDHFVYPVFEVLAEDNTVIGEIQYVFAINDANSSMGGDASGEVGGYRASAEVRTTDGSCGDQGRVSLSFGNQVATKSVFMQLC